MLPVAITAAVILFVLRFDRALTLFGTVWFATFAAMFSAVAGMHQFYTASLAVPVALLVGAAFAIARRRHALWAQLALIGIAAVTAIGIGFVGNGGAAFSRRSPSCSSSSRPSPVRSPSGSGAAECGCRSPQSSPRSRSS
jgi:hypothetical protein